MNKFLLFLLTLFAVYSCQQSDSTSNNSKTTTPAQLFYNGNILTMQSDKPIYTEAVVEQDGKIAFVGSQKEAETKFANAKKIDLKNRTLLPGFIDPHSHFGMVSN